MQSQACVLRWAVNIAAWDPTPAQWSLVLQQLPAVDQQRCLRYKLVADQKRAVVSAVLQRTCVARLLGVDGAADGDGASASGWQRVELRRTKGSKPFYAGSRSRADAPNFNFNVSHEGDYVVLACEGHCLCGVDVSAPQQLRQPGNTQKPLADTLSLLKPQLTAAEWGVLQSLSGDEAAMEAAFQAIWSCKEAFIKARGDGVAFELQRLHVSLPPATAHDWARQPVQPVALAVDGQELQQQQQEGQQQQQWRAYLQQLPGRHWVAVVRGPPAAAVDAHGEFTATFREPSPTPQQLQQWLDAPSPMFDLLEVEDVLPDEILGQYNELAAAGDDDAS